MANDWFEFKQFKVFQGKAAMKVGTDGVLLGAWTEIDEHSDILDIGTGTGLIALMCAQRSIDSTIDAVELDLAASEQAQENFTLSPWFKRLNVINVSIQDYTQQTIKQYDLIVSNPPFFAPSYKAKSSQRQMARDNESLSFENLLACVKKLLKEDGSFSVILPFDVSSDFVNQAEAFKLYLNRESQVLPTNKSNPKRVLMDFSFSSKTIVKDQLVIEPSQRHEYSEAYIDLCKDFYLKF